MFLGGFEIIAVIGIIVWLTKRSRAKHTGTAPSPVGDVLNSWLQRWQSAGLLSDDQVQAIISFEQSKEPDAGELEHHAARNERGIPLVAEALGYLGGLLAAIGAILLVAQYWPDLATGWRIGLPAAVALAGVVGGTLVSEHADDALRRLKWSLWLAGTAGLGAAGGVAMYEAMAPVPTYGWADEHRVVFGVASLVAVLSGVLWRGRERPIQQTTFLGGLLVAIGSAMNEWWELAGVGVAVWAIAFAFILIGQREIGTFPVITAIVGGAGMVVGSMLMIDRWSIIGAIFLAVSSMVMIGFGELPVRNDNDDLVSAFLVSGVFSLVLTVPTSLVQFNDDVFEAGIAVWVIGLLAYLIGERVSVRVPAVLLAIGGVAIVAGPAIVGIESTDIGTLLGLVTALSCLALGARPGQVLLSFVGAGSLLIYVPWSIAHFFPGEGRAPLLVAVSGVLIIGVALFLARSARRLSSET
jgi:hypothetical protein